MTIIDNAMLFFSYEEPMQYKNIDKANDDTTDDNANP
jgi:hypothetical protein